MCVISFLHLNCAPCMDRSGVCAMTLWLLAAIDLIGGRSFKRSPPFRPRSLKAVAKDKWCRTEKEGTEEIRQAPLSPPQGLLFSRHLTVIQFLRNIWDPWSQSSQVQVFSFISWNLCSAVLAEIMSPLKVHLQALGVGRIHFSDVGLTSSFSCDCWPRSCTLGHPGLSAHQRFTAGLLALFRSTARDCHLPSPAFQNLKPDNSGSTWVISES